VNECQVCGRKSEKDLTEVAVDFVFRILVCDICFQWWDTRTHLRGTEVVDASQID